MGKKYWRYDIKITPQKPFRKNMRSNIKWYAAKTPVKNLMGKLKENMTTYCWYCLLDNSHEKPFQGKTMDELWGQYVSLIFPTKTLIGKRENMTHAYVNITSLKTLTRNLASRTFETKEYNMVLVQVASRRCLPLILANSGVVAYQFHVQIFET